MKMSENNNKTSKKEDILCAQRAAIICLFQEMKDRLYRQKHPVDFHPVSDESSYVSKKMEVNLNLQQSFVFKYREKNLVYFNLNSTRRPKNTFHSLKASYIYKHIPYDLRGEEARFIETCRGRSKDERRFLGLLKC